MKLITKPSQKGRFDLHDLNNLDDIHNFGILPFEEEWQLACMIPERRERMIFLTTNTAGQVCHIDIDWMPIKESFESGKFTQLYARANISIKLQDKNIFCSSEEEIISVEQLKSECTNGYLKRFRIGSLYVDVKRPLCSIRLLFRGLAKDSVTGNKIFIKLNLFSAILTRVTDNLQNFDMNYFKKQCKGKSLYRDDNYEQWIQLKGQIEFESSQKQDIYFWGLYLKSFETERLILNHFFGWNTLGIGFHLVEIEGSKCDHIYGNINCSMSIVKTLEQHPSGKWNDLKVLKNSKDFIIFSQQNDKLLTYEIQMNDDIIQFSSDLWAFPIKLKKHDGYALLWKQVLNDPLPKDLSFESIKRPIKLIFEKDSSLVVSLDDHSAKNELFTGGKGSSLAILREFSKNSHPKFSVPDALIITVEGYKLFLDANQDLKKHINEHLIQAIKDSLNCSDKILFECEGIEQKIKHALLPEELREALKEKFQKYFGSFNDNDSFAIRSSAVGEDSEEMSAAGQMRTLLGVRGWDSIFDSIKICWASQFSITAIEYKRGYGQPLNSLMAVVIQRMIPSEIAGVMFTSSPLNGNQSFITITASYGLGESVVSGSVEPDTFTVRVDVNHIPWKVSKIESKILGDKKIKIELTDELTLTKDLDDIQKKMQCLNDQQILHLARIGLAVHTHFGNARDIEFGYFNGVWYLFQSRPVTNFNLLSEWEIMHELDTGHHSENEMLSRHNVGEVFPGASSYLVYDYVLRGWNSMTYISFSKMFNLDESLYVPYMNIGFHSAYNTIFFNSKSLISVFGKNKSNKNGKFQEGLQLTFRGNNDLGQDILDELFEKMPNFSFSGIQMLIAGWNVSKSILGSNRELKNIYKRFANFNIECDIEKSTSLDLWNLIINKTTAGREAYWSNAIASQESMIFNATLYYYLATKTEITDKTQVLELFSKITSRLDGVFSAQVPLKLQKIAEKIEDRNKFLEMSDEKAYEYLKLNNEEFCLFLKEYGHRGLKEFDPGSLTWEMNPISLVQALKSSVSYDSSLNEEEKDKSYDLSKYALSWFDKKILKSFIIPRVHRSIRNREACKNIAIRTYHQYRKLFYALADKLVFEGKLHQRELLFNMTIVEIEEFVHKPNPLIIINAKNRMRLQAKKDSLRFNEDTLGKEILPRNLEVKSKIVDGTKQCYGMPISSGKVIARCCVAERLEDAKNIKKGDILITFSTDIGWSPYFGAISGLVTEIGGLMSHGAVIAREYGLPCIVGVNQVTSIFQNGDLLLLDTANGLISKVESETKEEL